MKNLLRLFAFILIAHLISHYAIMAQVASPGLLDRSPLRECPGSPNCEHVAYEYNQSPSELANQVEAALRSLKPLSLTRDSIEVHEMHAVYRVWLFKDDVHTAIQPREGQPGSVLFIRSASRTGHADLGVNKRRVRRILKAIDK